MLSIKEIKKDFEVDNPVFLSGKLKAEPSGKFCNEIPKVKEKAEIKHGRELS